MYKIVIFPGKKIWGIVKDLERLPCEHHRSSRVDHDNLWAARGEQNGRPTEPPWAAMDGPWTPMGGPLGNPWATHWRPTGDPWAFMVGKPLEIHGWTISDAIGRSQESHSQPIGDSREAHGRSRPPMIGLWATYRGLWTPNGGPWETHRGPDGDPWDPYGQSMWHMFWRT